LLQNSPGLIRHLCRAVGSHALEPKPAAIEIEIDKPVSVEREHLAEDQPTDDRYPQRAPYFYRGSSHLAYLGMTSWL